MDNLLGIFQVVLVVFIAFMLATLVMCLVVFLFIQIKKNHEKITYTINTFLQSFFN